MRASRASAPTSAPRAPSAAPVSASPAARSGSRDHGSPPGRVADHDHGGERERDAEPEDRGDDAGERDLRGDEPAGRNEAARQPAEHVLVALAGKRAGGEHEREERDRQPERVALHLRGERRGSTALRQLDRAGSAPRSRAARRRSARARAVHRGRTLDALHALGLRQRVELALRAVEPDHVEALAEEAAVAAVQQQLDVLEVRVDVRALELLVERVDERLHLLANPARACRRA